MLLGVFKNGFICPLKKSWSALITVPAAAFPDKELVAFPPVVQLLPYLEYSLKKDYKITTHLV